MRKLRSLGKSNYGWTPNLGSYIPNATGFFASHTTLNVLASVLFDSALESEGKEIIGKA